MPRAGLTPARVVEDAAELADEVGWDRLTLAAVAQRLGVKLPSLYKHIDSLDALREEVSAVSARELGDVMARATMGRSGDDAVVALADAYRAWAGAHPGRYAATVAAPTATSERFAAASDEALEVVRAVRAGYGLTGDDAVDAARALRSTIHGFVDLEARHGFGLPADVDRSFHRLIDGIAATMRGWATGEAGA